MRKQGYHVEIVMMVAVLQMTESFLIPTMSRKVRTLETAVIERLETSSELDFKPRIVSVTSFFLSKPEKKL